MADRRVLREFTAELIGTFLLLAIGFSAVFLNHIYPSEGALVYNDCGGNQTKASVCGQGKGRLVGQSAFRIDIENMFILLVAIAFGGGLVGAILVTGHISGAHFNPSVTITLAALSKISWNKVLYYLPAQYLGAFLCTAAVHLYHLNHTTDANGKDITNELLYSVFVTSPHPKINILITMFDGLLSGFFLVLVVLSVGDSNSNGIPVSLQPIYVFICFCGVLISFSANAGAALNPARDLGPKLYVALFRGFKDVFDDFSYCYWWLPQQVCITLGFYIGGLVHYTVFEQIAPPVEV